jgi:tRNA pseudouridine38-40 synthase
MTHYKLTLAYDGTNFAGYQIQPHQRTVQGVLQKALGKMAKVDSIHIDGSGRTDSGVHALGQVVSFDFPIEIPEQAMLRAMNSLMPLDIEILKAEFAPEDFHARYSAKGKRYMYRVARGRFTDPFNRCIPDIGHIR